MDKIINIVNDGLNMAATEQFLFLRCKNTIFKYDLTDMSLAAQTDIFKKDGRSRGLALYGDYIFLFDFCDFYVLRQEDLQVMSYTRLGDDLSTDIVGIIGFEAPKVYMGIRNGRICVYDIFVRETTRFDICESSFWSSCITANRIYVGTVQGELLEVDQENLQVLRRTSLTSKKNIYSILQHDRMLYTVSLDKTIKAVDIETFEVVLMAKKAVDGMEVRILGIHDACLVVAFRSKITLWDIHTLQCRDSFDFPANRWNKGATLCGSRLFGSDQQGVYCLSL